ncbi:MAG TPA: alpha/beta hydrolase [Bacteroidia bacterium]|nr:alpha/beta hydrolase [Bacteroidia bacterium]
MIKYTTFRKARIRYSDEGKGRTIVLLHGFPENLGIWKEFSATLSKSFRVIAIDLPGLGESDSIGYVHTMDLMAECVHEVLKQLNLRRYIIVGHSMGGYVGLAFAELFPENLRGLCLFHSTAFADSDEKKIERDKASEAAKKHTAQFIKVFGMNLFANKIDPNIKKLQQITAGTSARGGVAALQGMKLRPSREIVLKFAPYTVLFILGKKDSLINWEKMMPQTEIPPYKKVVLLDEVAHMGFYEAPKETLRAVRGFAYKCFRDEAR